MSARRARAPGTFPPLRLVRGGLAPAVRPPQSPRATPRPAPTVHRRPPHVLLAVVAPLPQYGARIGDRIILAWTGDPTATAGRLIVGDALASIEYGTLRNLLTVGALVLCARPSPPNGGRRVRRVA